MSEIFDVVVIGAGPGGYVAAIRAAQLGLKTACVEKNPNLGGTCLNVGCIPSKALLHSSELFYKLKTEAKDLGIIAKELSCDFNRMMERKNGIVKTFNQGIEALFRKNKITHFVGEASLVSKTEISIKEVKGAEVIQAKNIILATGSEPVSLPFMPIDEKQIITSTGALALSSVPKKMIVVGAGIIGVELGSVYSRLGTEVVFVEFLDRICPTLDRTLSKELQHCLEKQGMQFKLNSKVVAASKAGGSVSLKVQTQSDEEEMKGDVVLVSIGRKPYTANLGLEKASIALGDKGFIPVDSSFRTSVSTIYAIGDIIDGPMLAHKASEEGVCVAEIIAGHKPSLEYITIPSVVYTYPEVSAVGFTEEEAIRLGFEVKVGKFPFKVNSRAKCTDEVEGLVKIIANKKNNKLLGMHIMGAHASEMIALGGLALRKKIDVKDLMELPFAHPTLSEAIKEACLDVFKQAIHM